MVSMLCKKGHGVDRQEILPINSQMTSVSKRKNQVELWRIELVGQKCSFVGNHEATPCVLSAPIPSQQVLPYMTGNYYSCPLLNFWHAAGLGIWSHCSTVELARCNHHLHCNSFFSRTSCQWDSLLISCFPDNYNLPEPECNVG